MGIVSNTSTAYWVCAYANNQHNLNAEIVADLRDSSFVKAIKLARDRVVTVLDEHGETYRRIWCVLEIFLGMEGTYEIITAKSGCLAFPNQYGTHKWTRGAGIAMDAVCITSAPCVLDSNHGVFLSDLAMKRQAAFPDELLESGMQVTVQNA